ncbi:hypothetical protein JCM3770_006759 [Rhodotorula araucariae]
MLTQTAFSLSVAATLATTAAAFHAPVLHNHGIRSGHAAHVHKAREFVPVRAALEARGNVRRAAKASNPRMAKRVRRSETAAYLELADNSTVSASTDASGTKFTSTAIWWKEAGWVGSCGVEIKETEIVVALPLALYPDVETKSSLCGTTVSVKATASGKTISATVVGASNRDDYTTFSKSAYLALEGDLDVGELAIEYFVDASHADLSNLVAKKKPATTSSAAPQKTTTSQAPKPTTTTTQKEAFKTAAAVKAAVEPTTASARTTTSSAAPAATSAAASDEGDDDWVCDDEGDASSSSSSSSVWVAPSSAAVKVASTSQWVAPTTTTTTTQQAQQTTSSAPAATTKVANIGDSSSLLAQQGISGFLKVNDGAILSWYNTNSAQDSTNGNSWCGFPYDNSVPGFAPALSTMLKDGSYEDAAKKYCGLEAIVTTPDGKSKTLYLADAFDDTWVLTPSSIDIIHGAFNELYGSSTDNKNDVIKGATWKFTGNRNDKYKFKSTNSLS